LALQLRCCFAAARTGVTYQATNEATYFVVSKLNENLNIIIPFFDKYPILGIKYADYIDFKTCALLMENKEHLTEEGLLKIKNLKSGMNRGRILN
jgi:hypothetical protein